MENQKSIEKKETGIVVEFIINGLWMFFVTIGFINFTVWLDEIIDQNIVTEQELENVMQFRNFVERK